MHPKAKSVQPRVFDQPTRVGDARYCVKGLQALSVLAWFRTTPSWLRRPLRENQSCRAILAPAFVFLMSLRSTNN